MMTYWQVGSAVMNCHRLLSKATCVRQGGLHHTWGQHLPSNLLTPAKGLADTYKHLLGCVVACKYLVTLFVDAVYGLCCVTSASDHVSNLSSRPSGG